MKEIRSVAHVLRVNHAGERGAICIYRGQIAVSRLFYPGCVDALTEMLGHERTHFNTFDGILLARGIRGCRALAFWAVGGWVLGIVTALFGPKAIWVCTAAIEKTVNARLEHQLAFLLQSDLEVLPAVESIQKDEEYHEAYASAHGGQPSEVYSILWWSVAGATSFAIWLSTHL